MMMSEAAKIGGLKALLVEKDVRAVYKQDSDGSGGNESKLAVLILSTLRAHEGFVRRCQGDLKCNSMLVVLRQS